MKTITLKNLPDSLHRALKARAAHNGRSLNREVMTCLEAATSVSRIEVVETLAGIDRIRSADGSRLDEGLLNRARAEGRP